MSLVQVDSDLYKLASTKNVGAGDMLRAVTLKSRPISIGIVGAGFAGLRCADVLLQHGFKVTIFEARNRVGGRVAQSRHLGHLVDLGPNWIHGTKDNPISKLAVKTGTQLHEWEEEEAIVSAEGQPLSAEEAGEYARLIWDDGIIADAFRYSKKHQSLIDPERSLYDYFVEKSEGMFMNEPMERAIQKRKKLLQTANMWGAYVGSPITRQSLRFYWLEECIEGENPFVAETYHKILNEVARHASERADIRFESKVTGIISAEIESENRTRERPTAGIEIEDGDRIDFDEVVVTTPLGWLKQNREAFKFDLPPQLSQAIDNIGYGTLDKVYITFPSAFWNASSLSERAQPGNRDTESKTFSPATPTSPSSQPPRSKNISHHPGFTHWLSPTYSPKTNPAGWDQQGMNLASLPPSCAHPTILFYIYGPCSKHVASIVSSAPDATALDKQLLEFFLPYYSRLPNYDTVDPACTPTSVLATAWANDEFAGYGSYSNFQVGLEKGDKDIEVMRWGMPERGIWLAGEHTAPFVALGTSTGAYWSGEGVAQRIAEAYGMERKQC